MPEKVKINRWDLSVVVLMVIITAVVLEWVYPMVSSWSGDQGSFARAALILFLTLTFLSCALYACFRFIPKGLKAIIFGLAFLPIFYAGVLLGGLKSSEISPNHLSVDRPRAQEVLSALWWAKQAALDLPEWSRGGTEFWPSTSGGFAIETRSNSVRMVFHPTLESARLCEQILSDFAAESSAVKNLKAEVVVDEKIVDFSSNFTGLCKNNPDLNVQVAL
jgi:hypothetical protein